MRNEILLDSAKYLLRILMRFKFLSVKCPTGYHSVLSADVRAHVETPGGVIEKLPLYDTGHGKSYYQSISLFSS